MRRVESAAVMWLSAALYSSLGEKTIHTKKRWCHCTVRHHRQESKHLGRRRPQLQRPLQRPATWTLIYPQVSNHGGHIK